MNKKYTNFVFVLFFAFLVFIPVNDACAVTGTFFPDRQHMSLYFSNQNKIDVAISNTNKQRALGLGFIKKISDKNGMLFIFKDTGKYSFWMKGMYIPIDMIFVDENKIVTDIYKKVSPSSYPKIFSPSKNIKYVIEVNSGNASRLGVKIGQKIIFSK